MKFLKAHFLYILIHLNSFAQSKPNIIFIMSDDHTSTAIGTYNTRLSSLNPTPTLDKLAEEGMVLENVFCNNSLCSPSRATIITGQYSAINGVTSLGGKITKDKQHLGIGMKKAGYQTAVIGKWHLGELPTSFDYYKVLHSQGDYFNPIFTEPNKPLQTFQKKKGKTEKGTVRMQGHSTDCIADSGLEWLKNRDKTKPFFLKLHFKAPHGPYDYAPRYENYLKGVKIPEPNNLKDRKNNGSIATRGHKDELSHIIGSSVSNRNTNRNLSSYSKEFNFSSANEQTSNSYQVFTKKFLRCVKGIDDNVKRVLDFIKREGLEDNTIVIYTADQGYYLGEHDYFDKRWGYEEGMRMPFIIKYPKHIKANQRNDAIIENIDFAPTLLDFANTEAPKEMHGKSFKSILLNNKTPKNWKDRAYYHYALHMSHHGIPAHIGLRTKDYKLLFFYGSREKDSIPNTPPGWELYDLNKDPFENNNIYDNLKYQNVVSKLKNELETLRTNYKLDDSSYPYNKIINEYWDYTEEDKVEAIKISNELAKSFIHKDKKKAKKSKNKKKTLH